LFIVANLSWLGDAIANDVTPLATTLIVQLKHATLTAANSDSSQLDHEFVTLPHHWNGDSPQRQGLYTYQLQFVVAENQLQSKQALYFIRIGNRFEITLNDRLLHSSGELSNPSEGLINEPTIVAIPPGLLRLGSNNLALKISGDAGRYAGLSTVQFGEFKTLDSSYSKRYFFQQSAPVLIMVICLTIGFLALLASWYLKNKHYFIFGIGSMAWALATSFEKITYTPYGYRWQLLLYDLSLALGVACMVLSLTYSIRFRKRWFVLLAYGYFALSAVLAVVTVLGFAFTRQLFLLLMIAFALFTAGIYLWQCYKNPARTSLPILALVFICLVVALYDQITLFKLKNSFEAYSLTRYVYLFFAVAIAQVFVLRLTRMNNMVKANKIRLHKRLKLTRDGLHSLYLQQLEVEKLSVLSNERIRLMQDMHDGLGSRLLALKIAVLRSKNDHFQLVKLVDNSIDELRQAVLALKAPHTNLAHMLGMLRPRIEQLLTGKKSQLTWSVEAIPDLPQFDTATLCSLEKMVLELFTNVMKHSSATRIEFKASFTVSGTVHISFIENGTGYVVRSHRGTPFTSTTGLGLMSLCKRAADLGATIEFKANGCETSIIIPITDQFTEMRSLLQA
jgi:signal transduction histidine kinase